MFFGGRRAHSSLGRYQKGRITKIHVHLIFYIASGVMDKILRLVLSLLQALDVVLRRKTMDPPGRWELHLFDLFLV